MEKIDKSHSKKTLCEIIEIFDLKIANYINMNKKELSKSILYELSKIDKIKEDKDYYFIKDKGELMEYLVQPDPSKSLTVKEKDEVMNLAKFIIIYCNNNYYLSTSPFLDHDDMIKKAKDISAYGGKSPFIIHFRYATHGENIGTDNVHPFKVNNGLVFAHNGIISNVSENDQYSDTQMFNKEVLQKLPEKFLNDTITIKLLSGFTSGSKLAFLDSKKNVSIINEKLGHWNDENTMWFSNYGYCDTQKYNYGSYTGYGNYKDYGRYKDYGNSYSYPKVLDKKLPSCDWCGFDSGDLVKCDVSDWYTHEGSEKIIANLCPECNTGKEVDEKDGGSFDDISFL